MKKFIIKRITLVTVISLLFILAGWTAVPRALYIILLLGWAWTNKVAVESIDKFDLSRVKNPNYLRSIKQALAKIDKSIDIGNMLIPGGCILLWAGVGLALGYDNTPRLNVIISVILFLSAVSNLVITSDVMKLQTELDKKIDRELGID